MKNTIKFLLLSIVLSTTCITSISEAEDSPVSIQVIESPLRLVKVTSPTFEPYEINRNEKKQVIGATKDLEIQIEDNRTTSLSSWGLQYELSMFKGTSSTTSSEKSLLLFIGYGELYVGDERAPEDFYKAQATYIEADNPSMLFQTNKSKNSTFYYRVPKEKINLNIPNDLDVGTYQATQTITLINVPDVPN